MYRYIIFAALLAVTYGQTTIRPTPSNCTICHEIVGHAERNIHNVTSQQQLQNILIQECHHMERRDGPVGTANCVGMVNDNIAKIYTDMKAGKRVGETCYDIGACNSAPTRAPATNEDEEKHKIERANFLKIREAMIVEVQQDRKVLASHP